MYKVCGWLQPDSLQITIAMQWVRIKKLSCGILEQLYFFIGNQILAEVCYNKSRRLFMGINFSILSIFKVTSVIIMCMTCMIEVLVLVWYVGAVDWDYRNQLHMVCHMILFMLVCIHQKVFDYNFRLTVCRSNFLSMLKF